jgi:group I intron endonuclease
MGYIYRITNIVNGKVYIGETRQKDPEKRWSLHKQSVNWKRGGCPLLRAAMVKYGIDKFRFEVIVICFDESLHEMEREYIKKYNSITPNGYNILEGGQCGGGFKGKNHTPETIIGIKEKLRTRYKDPALRARMSEIAKESNKNVDIGFFVKSSEKFQKAKAEGRVGAAGWRTRSTEEKRREIYGRVSASLKKYYETLDEEKITHINVENHRIAMSTAKGSRISSYKDGNFVKSYLSVADASRDINVNKNAVLRALKDPFRFTCRGLTWKYTPCSEDA